MSRPSLVSSRAVGGMNRALVLRTLADHGPLSRSDLARRAGVARATIGSIVQGLLDDHVLEEHQPIDDGQVGKPARPLWFAAGAGTVVAIELRSEGARGALVDARGTLSSESTAPFRDRSSPEHVIKVVTGLARELSVKKNVLGVGMAVPGTTDLSTGEIIGSLQVPGAEGRTLVEQVREAAGVPAFVENDSRGQALAEQWFGAGRGVDTFTSVQTGTGLSVGLVFDGAVYRGPNGVAGELGHTTVAVDGERCTCGLRGGWETMASIGWLRRAAKDAGIRGSRTVDCAKLQVLADRGNGAARRLLGAYADRLAIGLANLRQLLGSDYFIIHGDAVGGGDDFRVLLTEATNARSLAPVRITFSELGDRATVLGAAAVVLGELLHL